MLLSVDNNAIAQTPTSPLNVSFFVDNNCLMPLSKSGLEIYPTYEYWASVVPPSAVWTNYSFYPIVIPGPIQPCTLITYPMLNITRNTKFLCIPPNSTIPGEDRVISTGGLTVFEWAPPSKCEGGYDWAQSWHVPFLSYNTCQTLTSGWWQEGRNGLGGNGSVIIYSYPFSQAPPPTPPNPPNTKISSSGLSGGDIAAIVISIVLVIIFLIGGLYYYRYRQLRKAIQSN